MARPARTRRGRGAAWWRARKRTRKAPRVDGAAADAAERLRSAIAQIARGFTEHPDIRISASIGLTGWRFGEGLDDALLRADAACYEAKNTGRNRVRRAA